MYDVFKRNNNHTLSEKCPNTEFFLVRILPYSVQHLSHCDIVFQKDT